MGRGWSQGANQTRRRASGMKNVPGAQVRAYSREKLMCDLVARVSSTAITMRNTAFETIRNGGCLRAVKEVVADRRKCRAQGRRTFWKVFEMSLDAAHSAVIFFFRILSDCTNVRVWEFFIVASRCVIYKNQLPVVLYTVLQKENILSLQNIASGIINQTFVV